jgi:ribulose-phosphate 3-epimerase
MARFVLFSPSILSADFTCLGDQLREAELAGADWFHIDVMDGHFVPNLTMGPFIVEACRRATQLPLDVHLMIESPERLLRAFADAGADWLTVHQETCPHLHRTLETIHELGLKAGASLNPGTPVGSLSEVLPSLDLILIMTVDPGFSGGKYVPLLDKIKAVRGWRDQGHTTARIAVDGGISPTTAPEVVQAGADVLIAASAVFKHPDGIRAGLESLRASVQQVPA